MLTRWTAQQRQEEKEKKQKDSGVAAAISGDDEAGGARRSGKWRKLVPTHLPGTRSGTAATEPTEAEPSQPDEETPGQQNRQSTHISTDIAPAAADGTSPTSKVKHWLRSRFTRGRSWSGATEDEDAKRGFIGGAALRESNDSNVSLSNHSASMAEVAYAGKSREQQEAPPTSAPTDQSATDAADNSSSRGRVRSIGSEESDGEVFQEAPETLTPGAVSPLSEMTPPRPIRELNDSKNSSPTRDSRFREII